MADAPSPALLALLPTAQLLSWPEPLRRRDEIRALTWALLRARDETTLLLPDERALARQAWLQAIAFNLPRLARLDAILDAAAPAGLTLVPFKGAYLARALYGDAAARPMVDLDLACRPAQLEAARALLEQLGFQAVAAEPRREARREQLLHDLKFVDGAVTVELHYRLWHELGMPGDIEPLVAGAQLVAGRPAPDPVEHLFIVLVHAATHGFAGNPLWLVDAALLLDGAPDIWPRLAARARDENALVPLAAAIDQLALVFPDCVPPSWRTAPSLRRELLRRLAPWLQRGEGELGPWPSRLVRALLFSDGRHLLRWTRDKLAIWWEARP